MSELLKSAENTAAFQLWLAGRSPAHCTSAQGAEIQALAGLLPQCMELEAAVGRPSSGTS